MNRTLMIISMLFVTVSFCNTKSIKNNQASTLKDSFAIYGDWKIIRFVDGYISEITDEDAQKYVGKVITLKPTLAVIINDTCDQPFFKITTQSSDRYFYENDRIDKASLKITQDSIGVVELSCKNQPNYSRENSSNFSYDFIIINKDLLIVGFKGFYFYLKRIH